MSQTAYLCYSMRNMPHRHFYRPAASLSTNSVFGGDKIFFCGPNVKPPIETRGQTRCHVSASKSYSLRGRDTPGASTRSTTSLCTFRASAHCYASFSHTLKRGSSFISNSSLTKEEIESVEQLSNDIIGLNYDSEERCDKNNLSEQMMRRRIALSKAITLVESKSANRRLMGDILLDRLRRSTGDKVNGSVEKSGMPFRLGIAGPPGAGKSVSD